MHKDFGPSVQKNPERIDRMVKAMRSSGFDAIICALPSNVLLLTGYWPVVGSSIAILTKEGELSLLAPSDESAFFKRAAVDTLILLEGGPLSKPTSLIEDVHDAFSKEFNRLGLADAVIGLETNPVSEQSSYVAMHLYLDGLLELVKRASATAIHKPCDELLWHERAVLTKHEISRLKVSCAIAGRAYESGRSALREGTTEIEAAQYLQTSLSTFILATDSVQRAEGRVACMSGINSGSAYGAYAMSSRKVIERGDLVLTHCNSQADGYWTDITRTYSIGAPSERVVKMYEAMFAAREAGLHAVRPGATGHDIDIAVREVLTERGFGDQFKHGTGHGVGFRAIDHRAKPRLRPNSPDVLETGMVFNIEPGIYFEDFGGMRHCDMVAVTDTGYELLTPLQTTVEEMIVG